MNVKLEGMLTRLICCFALAVIFVLCVLMFRKIYFSNDDDDDDG